ncbi:MAG: aminoacyl-tRNA hydrolase [Planctomycetota bacterium]
MKLIVGLGNPGGNYARTRHNVGFRVADLLAEQLGAGFDRNKFKGEYAEASLPRLRHAPKPAAAARGPADEAESEDTRLLLVKPQTFMNLSGETVAAFAGYFKISLADVLVVADDVALPLGQLRLRRGGSDGGHNGLKDISLRLGGKSYARLRVGIGGREAGVERPAPDLAEHVLSRFSVEEADKLEVKLELAAEACLSWAQEGIEAAMNKYNAKEKTQDS